jgi:hypothetical protein
VPDSKISALTALSGANLADGDEMPVVDVSDTTMAATGTNKYTTLADLWTYISARETVRGSSVTTPGAGFAADTYVAGSGLLIPNGRLKAQTIYRCTFDVSKTAAGVATPIINVRIGTAGSTADASRGTHTFPAQTAVVDQGVFEVWAAFRTVGAGTAAVLQSRCRLTHGLSITGFSTSVSPVTVATSAGFDSTPNGSIIGISVNGGASAAWTITLVEAELVNLV